MGAAFIEGPILHLSSEPGGTSVLEHVTTPTDLFDLLADPPGLDLPGTLALQLDLDLSGPASPDDLVRGAVRTPVITLDPAMSGLGIVLLVGIGVVRASAVADVRELARRVGWGVVSTWDARGVERWDSPFDFGTVGLQERDIDLSGLLDADVVITSGLDPDGFDLGPLASKLVQDVPPRQLSALVRDWPISRQPPERSTHHDVLAEVLVPMYESDAVPLTAPRAVLHLAGALPDDGVIIGGPGPSGFWLARSCPTSAPESLCVPATTVPGFVAAATLVCAIEERPHVGVIDRVDDPTTDAVVELADGLGLAVNIQSWGDRNETAVSTSADHVELTLRRSRRTGTRVPEVSTEAVGSAHVSVDDGEPHVVPVPVMTERLETLSLTMGEPLIWGGPASWADPDGGSNATGSSS